MINAKTRVLADTLNGVGNSEPASSDCESCVDAHDGRSRLSFYV